MILSPYLYDCLDTKRLKRIVNQAVKHLKPFTRQFDGIVFRGVSGALVAPAVAMALNKKMIVVRDGCRRHSKEKVEGSKDIKKCIIIDDISETGRTIRYMMKHLSVFSPDTMIVGRYLYSPGSKQLMMWNPKTKLNTCINYGRTWRLSKFVV